MTEAETKLAEINAKAAEHPDGPVVVLTRTLVRDQLLSTRRNPKATIKSNVIITKPEQPLLLEPPTPSSALQLNTKHYVPNATFPPKNEHNYSNRPHHLTLASGIYDLSPHHINMLPLTVKNQSYWMSPIPEIASYINPSLHEAPSIEFFYGSEGLNKLLRRYFEITRKMGESRNLFTRLYRATELIGFGDLVEPELKTAAKEALYIQRARAIEDLIKELEPPQLRIASRISSDEKSNRFTSAVEPKLVTVKDLGFEELKDEPLVLSYSFNQQTPITTVGEYITSIEEYFKQ